MLKHLNLQNVSKPMARPFLNIMARRENYAKQLRLQNDDPGNTIGPPLRRCNELCKWLAQSLSIPTEGFFSPNNDFVIINLRTKEDRTTITSCDNLTQKLSSLKLKLLPTHREADDTMVFVDHLPSSLFLFWENEKPNTLGEACQEFTSELYRTHPELSYIHLMQHKTNTVIHPPRNMRLTFKSSQAAKTFLSQDTTIFHSVLRKENKHPHNHIVPKYCTLCRKHDHRINDPACSKVRVCPTCLSNSHTSHQASCKPTCSTHGEGHTSASDRCPTNREFIKRERDKLKANPSSSQIDAIVANTPVEQQPLHRSIATTAHQVSQNSKLLTNLFKQQQQSPKPSTAINPSNNPNLNVIASAYYFACMAECIVPGTFEATYSANITANGLPDIKCVTPPLAVIQAMKPAFPLAPAIIPAATAAAVAPIIPPTNHQATAAATQSSTTTHQSTSTTSTTSTSLPSTQGNAPVPPQGTTSDPLALPKPLSESLAPKTLQTPPRHHRVREILQTDQGFHRAESTSSLESVASLSSLKEANLEESRFPLPKLRDPNSKELTSIPKIQECIEAIPHMFPLPPAPGVTTDFHLLTPELAKKMHLHWADLVNIALGTATIKIHEDLKVPPILIEVNPFTKVPISHSESTTSSVPFNSPVTPKRSRQTSPTESIGKTKQRKSSQSSPASTRTVHLLQNIVQSRETVNVILNGTFQHPQELAPIIAINHNDADKAKPLWLSLPQLCDLLLEMFLVFHN